MPLTERQRRYYASAPIGEVGRTGLSLFHPLFDHDWHLTNFARPFEGLVDGALVTFQPHPFEVDRPEIGADGKSDLRLNIHNSGAVFTRNLLAAAEVAEPRIRVLVNDYLPGETASQIATIEMDFVAMTLTPENCTGSALGADFLNQEFPRGFYRLTEFPGLDR